MLYEKHYTKLEKLRWRLDEDIAWDAIQPDLLSDKQKDVIRNICMTEIGALYAAEAFLRDFNNNIDFSCFISVWYYEEMKHFMVLKQYLSHIGIEISEPELQHLRMTIPESNQETILMVHFLSEHQLASWYQCMCDWLDEPVAKDIFTRISADEIRHGQAYFDFIQKDLSEHPERMVKYLRAAMFMLSPKAPRDMHAVTLTQTTHRLDDPEYILFIEDTIVPPEKRVATAKRIYSLLSQLANQPIADYAALSCLVGELKQTEKSNKLLSVLESV